MATIHDVADLIVFRHGPIDLDKLHKLLFYANAASLRDRGEPLFRDSAIALPSGPVYPVIDVTLQKARWRRRFEARYDKRGRRGARRIPPIESMIKSDPQAA